jgi:hypothetical protein
MSKLLRDEIEVSDIVDININIAAYQRMIDFYENYEPDPEDETYVASRLNYLYGIQSEYLIAREISKESAEPINFMSN